MVLISETKLDSVEIKINGRLPDEYIFEVSPPNFDIAAIPTIGSDIKKYSIWAKTLKINVLHKLFNEIEFNILDSMHTVKWDETEHMFILKMDNLTNLQLKVGSEDNKVWVRICN